MKTTGEKLRDLRNLYGMSQREFGEKTGVTRGSINSYENNINPLSMNAKWKILQATGIGFEYFDTDMTMSEAFAKYHIDPNTLEIKDIQECICSFYENIKDYVEGKSCNDPLNAKAYFLNFLFNDLGNFDLNFVKVKQRELEPFAKSGEILVVVRDENVENGDKIIVEFETNIAGVQYFNQLGEIKLTMDDREVKFKPNEFKQSMKILGIVKGKYTFN